MHELELLTGKVALVTGATSGIGFHTATSLARLGGTVYITGRDVARGQAAEEQIRATAGQQNVRFVTADAATVGGNQLLARQIMSETDRRHILVNNVGGAHNDRWETADEYEATLAMNFVGPFALTQALLPQLRASVPARIVNVASMSHAWFKTDPFADVQSIHSFLGSDAYSREAAERDVDLRARVRVGGQRSGRQLGRSRWRLDLTYTGIGASQHAGMDAAVLAGAPLAAAARVSRSCGALIYLPGQRIRSRNADASLHQRQAAAARCFRSYPRSPQPGAGAGTRGATGWRRANGNRPPAASPGSVPAMT